MILTGGTTVVVVVVVVTINASATIIEDDNGQHRRMVAIQQKIIQLVVTIVTGSMRSMIVLRQCNTYCYSYRRERGDIQVMFCLRDLESNR